MKFLGEGITSQKTDSGRPPQGPVLGLILSVSFHCIDWDQNILEGGAGWPQKPWRFSN